VLIDFEALRKVGRERGQGEPRIVFGSQLGLDSRLPKMPLKVCSV